MTRYTKLDRRKAPHKATDYFAAVANADAAAAESSRTAASFSASPEPRPSRSRRKCNANDLEDGEDQSNGDRVTKAKVSDLWGSEAASDPKRLHARMKLLRLKLKRAKTEERQKPIKAELKELLKAISAANGQRGSGRAEDPAAPRRKRRYAGALGSDSTGHQETNPWKTMEAERRAKSAAKDDVRREKRMKERTASTRCFACRSMGHAARDCPSALNVSSVALESDTTGEGDDGADGAANAPHPSLVGRETVGICFRCGSTEHTLAYCRRPAPWVGSDVPFATCFVCGQKGHLSSKCPKNTNRGIYPNGGCCKLCQCVEHLAKDCHLRSSSVTAATNATMAASKRAGGRAPGADDDDFHAFARNKMELERDEKQSRGRQQQAQSAADQTRSSAPEVPKKIVSF